MSINHRTIRGFSVHYQIRGRPTSNFIRFLRASVTSAILGTPNAKPHVSTTGMLRSFPNHAGGGQSGLPKTAEGFFFTNHNYIDAINNFYHIYNRKQNEEDPRAHVSLAHGNFPVIMWVILSIGFLDVDSPNDSSYLKDVIRNPAVRQQHNYPQTNENKNHPTWIKGFIAPSQSHFGPGAKNLIRDDSIQLVYLCGDHFPELGGEKIEIIRRISGVV